MAMNLVVLTENSGLGRRAAIKQLAVKYGLERAGTSTLWSRMAANLSNDLIDCDASAGQ